jgi:O-antigen ligase
VLWQASLLLIRDHWLTGVGVGNGPLELPNYIASLTSEYNHRATLPSHNPLLEVGVETGIVGMVIYVCLWVAALWQFIRHRNRQVMREGVLAAYFPILLGVTAGYFATWIKAGGLVHDPISFVLLALLVIPSQLLLVSDTAINRSAKAAELARQVGDCPEYQFPSRR